MGDDKKELKKDDNGNDDDDDQKEKKEEDEESEYEEVTDDEEDDDIDDDDDDDDNNKINNDRMAELLKLKREKEINQKMRNDLNTLSSSLENIRSQPMIIDLTKKKKRNDDLSQEIIGRQMKLRDIHLKYQKIRNDIKKQNENEEKKEEKQRETKELGEALGQIEIPNSSLKSLGFDKKCKVLLPTQHFDRLQTSFL